MSDETNIVPVKTKAVSNFRDRLKSVKGLSENSQLRRIQKSGALRLTVDGNMFQIKKGSKVVQTIKDGKKPVKELQVVIHSISPVIQQQLAEKWDPKDPKFVPMGCWSNDGRTPDEDAWNKQSSKCDTCKHGGNGDMQCSLTRLAVVSIVSANVPEEPMLMNFNWSSNSTKKPGQDVEENLFSLISYLDMLAAEEVEPYRIITNLVVDDWSDPKNNCKLLFQPVDIVQDDHPNYIAHKNWEEDSRFDLEEMILIKQRPPQEGSAGSEAGAPEKEEEEKAETAAEKKKRLAAEKRKEAARKKKEAQEAKAAEEVEDLDDLESFGEEEEPDADDEEELLEESDDDDFGDLDDLLN